MAPSAAPAAASSSSSAGAATAPPIGVAPPIRSGPRPQASASGSAPHPTEPRCAAPSLEHRKPIDARDAAAIDRCEDLRTGLAKQSKDCGVGEREAKDLQRFLAAVPPLDTPTVERIRQVFMRGKELGRNARVFGMVGDSITVSPDFLGSFAKKTERRVLLSEWVVEQLTMRSGPTIVDYFREGVAELRDGVPRDSFSAYRAAKVGARATWPLQNEEANASPIEQLTTRINPAFAVVTFGANDAAYKIAPPEQVAADFERHTLALVRALESRGVVVILSNEMRHGDQPGVKACPKDAEMNDWRVAVGTNATSARAAEIACREHLPLIDLRHALDAATNYGLGPDGVHLTTFQRGAGVLDEHGLDCGNNIRNLVTLIALRQVVEATVLSPNTQ